jgi:predicted Holliday junction resolvase-like endonuclease
MINFIDLFYIAIFGILFWVINNYSVKNKNLNALLESLIKEIDFLTSTINETEQKFQFSATIVEKKKDEISFLEKEKANLQLNLEKKESLLQIEFKKQEIAKSNLQVEIKKARQETLKKSRAVLRGQASEHLAPFVIPDTNPKDYRFMGNPIDYICFDGLSDILDGESDKINFIRLIDIKTGKSSLSKTQRRIRDAIKEGKITFEVINLDKQLKETK